MSHLISRRDFIQRMGGFLAALTLPFDLQGRRRGPAWGTPLPPDEAASRAGQSLGRVTIPRLHLHAAPDPTSEITEYRSFDALVTLYSRTEPAVPAREEVLDAETEAATPIHVLRYGVYSIAVGAATWWRGRAMVPAAEAGS